MTSLATRLAVVDSRGPGRAAAAIAAGRAVFLQLLLLLHVRLSSSHQASHRRRPAAAT
jgi:hypothetical protein